MPRTCTPASFAAADTMARDSMYGTAARTPGVDSATSRARRQSGSGPSRPMSVACDVTDRMRERSSRSKPFITDNTTTSTATPRARPSTLMTVMKERNPRRCPERR